MLVLCRWFSSDGWNLYLTERGRTKVILIRWDTWLCRCAESGIFLAPRKFEIRGERRAPSCGFKGNRAKVLHEFHKRETICWLLLKLTLDDGYNDEYRWGKMNLTLRVTWEHIVIWECRSTVMICVETWKFKNQSNSFQN